jgi:2-octaprenylphenol hydroxylase
VNEAIDVAVIGSGLVGKAFALAAARAATSAAPALALALIGPRERAARDDHSFDSRVYALSPGNAAFLESLGAWQLLPGERRTAVYAMRVHGDDGESVIEFDAYRAGVPALAWIVEDGRLQDALDERLDLCEAVRRDPAPLEQIDFGTSHASLRSGGKVWEARLAVGADGANSAVRAAARIDARIDSYAQTAVVANFGCERPHRGVALQWFQRGAVLALLPLSGERVSMVWSTGADESARLLALEPQALCAEVETASRSVLGALELITPARGLPLQRLRARRAVAARVALIGDAAHVVHPLAGQGANLGLQDAKSLAALLAARAPFRDPGDLRLLRRYERNRAEPVLLMQAGIDGLQRLFSAHGAAAAFVRNRGLNLVDRLPVVKNIIARQAMA